MPVHRKLYLGLFLFVNLWSIAIHDSELVPVSDRMDKIINGPSHHTLRASRLFTCTADGRRPHALHVGRCVAELCLTEQGQLRAVLLLQRPHGRQLPTAREDRRPSACVRTCPCRADVAVDVLKRDGLKLAQLDKSSKSE